MAALKFELPCPFCGSRILDMDYDGGVDARIRCDDCLTEGPVATIGCRDEDETGPIDIEAEARDLWNARVRILEKP